MKKKFLEIYEDGHDETPLNSMSETADGVLVGSTSNELQKTSNNNFKTANEGNEYISPDQHGGIYGTVYRQYHGAQANASTISTPGITRLVAFGGTFNGDTCYCGFAGDGVSKITMTKITDNVRADVTGWAITTGWIDYTK